MHLSSTQMFSAVGHRERYSERTDVGAANEKHKQRRLAKRPAITHL